jgi:putative oxidoreductase
MFKSLAKYADLGLLIGRIGIGATFMVFGWQTLSGGQAAWTKVGSAMGALGIHFYPTFWGLMATLSEFGGGILLILGLLFRPSAALIGFTMFVAVVFTFRGAPRDFLHYSRPLELFCIAIVFLFVGPGKYSIDRG